MTDLDDASARILARLRQEFVESARDQIDDIEIILDRLESGAGDAEEDLHSIQRDIHNIKGQGPTFGFPLTGRIAHMLEDYLINAGGLKPENLSDIRVYLGLMVILISTDEALGEDDPQDLLNSLPTGQVVTYSHQKLYDVSVLLVMPSGLQRKMVARELLSCGFRVMRAYDSIEALSVAVDVQPDIVFVNYEMTPFTGHELCNVLCAVNNLKDINIVLLTSYDHGDPRLQGLPDNVSVVQKHADFTEAIGELMIGWGVFGTVQSPPKNPSGQT